MCLVARSDPFVRCVSDHTLSLILIVFLLPHPPQAACPSASCPPRALLCALNLKFTFTHGFSESSCVPFFHLFLLSFLLLPSTVMAARNITPVAIPLILNRRQPRSQYQNQYLPNGNASGPVPGAQALLPNNGRIIQSGPIRVLCIADVRGQFIPLGLLGYNSLSLTSELQATSNPSTTWQRQPKQTISCTPAILASMIIPRWKE